MEGVLDIVRDVVGIFVEWAPECVDSLWSLDIRSSGRYPVKAMKAPVNEE